MTEARAAEGRGHLVATHLLVAICCGILTEFGKIGILRLSYLVFCRLIFGSHTESSESTMTHMTRS